MVKAVRKIWVALLVGAMVMAGQAGVARAVDAPKWVAVLYVGAQNAVGLRWMPVSGATGYKILRSETAGSGYAEIASSPQPQHFDKTAEPGSTYYYVLQAVAGAEVSPNSDERNVRIPGQKKVETKPPKFSKVVPQSSTEFGKTVHKVGFIWGAVPQAIAYNLYRSTEKGKGYQLILSGAETQAIDSTVEEGKTYYYVLSALDGSFQETKYSPEQQVTIKKSKKKKRKKKVKLVVKGRASEVLWTREKDDAPGFGFWEPYDAALNSAETRLYATSNSTAEIYVFNTATGETIQAIGEKGKDEGKLLYPLGIWVTADDRLLVADRSKQAILIYNAVSGSFAKEIKLTIPPNSLPENLQNRAPEPMDVLVDEASGEIYVADRGINRVWVLDSGGKFIRFIGTSGKTAGTIGIPFYINWDVEGNLVVVNGASTTIATFDKSDGTYLRSFGQRAPKVGAFVFIAGFDWDPEGNFLVIDKAASNIQGMLPDGRYLYHAADASGEKGVELFSPKALVVDSKGRFFVVQGLVNKITAFQFTGPVPSPQQEPPEAEAQE